LVTADRVRPAAYIRSALGDGADLARHRAAIAEGARQRDWPQPTVGGRPARPRRMPGRAARRRSPVQPSRQRQVDHRRAVRRAVRAGSHGFATLR